MVVFLLRIFIIFIDFATGTLLTNKTDMEDQNVEIYSYNASCLFFSIMIPKELKIYDYLTIEEDDKDETLKRFLFKKIMICFIKCEINKCKDLKDVSDDEKKEMLLFIIKQSVLHSVKVFFSRNSEKRQICTKKMELALNRDEYKKKVLDLFVVLIDNYLTQDKITFNEGSRINRNIALLNSSHVVTVPNLADFIYIFMFECIIDLSQYETKDLNQIYIKLFREMVIYKEKVCFNDDQKKLNMKNIYELAINKLKEENIKKIIAVVDKGFSNLSENMKNVMEIEENTISLMKKKSKFILVNFAKYIKDTQKYNRAVKCLQNLNKKTKEYLRCKKNEVHKSFEITETLIKIINRLELINIIDKCELKLWIDLKHNLDNKKISISDSKNKKPKQSGHLSQKDLEKIFLEETDFINIPESLNRKLGNLKIKIKNFNFCTYDIENHIYNFICGQYRGAKKNTQYIFGIFLIDYITNLKRKFYRLNEQYSQKQTSSDINLNFKENNVETLLGSTQPDEKKAEKTNTSINLEVKRGNFLEPFDSTNKNLGIGNKAGSDNNFMKIKKLYRIMPLNIEICILMKRKFCGSCETNIDHILTTDNPSRTFVNTQNQNITTFLEKPFSEKKYSREEAFNPIEKQKRKKAAKDAKKLRSKEKNARKNKK